MPRKPQFSKEEIARHGLKIVEERLKYYEENLELLEKSKKAEELVQKINDKKLRDEILELF